MPSLISRDYNLHVFVAELCEYSVGLIEVVGERGSADDGNIVNVNKDRGEVLEELGEAGL